MASECRPHSKDVLESLQSVESASYQVCETAKVLCH